jgi:hypothetical protein
MATIESTSKELYDQSCNWYIPSLYRLDGSADIHSKACQYYVASFWLLPVQFNVLMPPTALNPTQVATLLKQISISTGAEVVFKSMCFEMHGLEHEVRAAVNTVSELDIVKVPSDAHCTSVAI